MKVLFVCKGNVNRSQIAEAFYNLYTNSNDADSAGTESDLPGVTLRDRKKIVGNMDSIELMKAQGLDISEKTMTQLTKDMLSKYQQVISMCDSATAPKWLVDSPNYIHWDIEDPGGHDESQFSETLEIIKNKVKTFVDKKAQ